MNFLKNTIHKRFFFLLLDAVDKLIKPPKDSKWEMLKKPKAEFVDCKCNWGLFRDRNITMRKPIRIFSGTYTYLLYECQNFLYRTQWARKFKKVQAKKLVKSNKSFFREIVFLAVLNFFPVQKLVFGHF